MLGLVDPEQVDELRGADPMSINPARSRKSGSSSPTEAKLLCAYCSHLDPSRGQECALRSWGASSPTSPNNRTGSLISSLRLRRIGAEVRAAGLIDTAASSTFQDHPEIGDLSSRQWEILSRLLDGERVPTIARNCSSARAPCGTISRRSSNASGCIRRPSCSRNCASHGAADPRSCRAGAADRRRSRASPAERIALRSAGDQVPKLPLLRFVSRSPAPAETAEPPKSKTAL